MLAPLLVYVAARSRRSGPSGRRPAGTRRPAVVPWFVAGFLMTVSIRTLGVVPGGGLDVIRLGETLLLGAGLVGLGSAVRPERLRMLGGRPLVLGLTSWLLVACVSLAAVELTLP